MSGEHVLWRSVRVPCLGSSVEALRPVRYSVHCDLSGDSWPCALMPCSGQGPELWGQVKRPGQLVNWTRCDGDLDQVLADGMEVV